MDIGAGSIILGMVALRLGANSALEVEHDSIAVKCARDYAQKNKFGTNLEFCCETLKEVNPQGVLQPDLVFANLDSQTVLLLRE